MKAAEDGGWHFTSIGSTKQLIEKIEAFVHKEFNKSDFKDPARLTRIIEEGGDIFGSGWKFEIEALNDSFPDYLLKNRNKYNHLLKLD